MSEEEVISPVLTVRPELAAFVQEMERVLRFHDTVKRDSWKSMGYADLRVLLDGEVSEYVNSRKAEELIDVANLCMMLFWREKLVTHK